MKIYERKLENTDKVKS